MQINSLISFGNIICSLIPSFIKMRRSKFNLQSNPYTILTWDFLSPHTIMRAQAELKWKITSYKEALGRRMLIQRGSFCTKEELARLGIRFFFLYKDWCWSQFFELLGSMTVPNLSCKITAFSLSQTLMAEMIFSRHWEIICLPGGLTWFSHGSQPLLSLYEEKKKNNIEGKSGLPAMLLFSLGLWHI